MPKLLQERQQISEQFLNMLWHDLAFLTLFALPASLVRALQTGWLPLYFLHIGIACLVWAIAYFRTSIHRAVKSTAVTIFLIILGTGGLLNYGLAANGVIWLIAAAIIASQVYRRAIATAVIAGIVLLFLLIAQAFVEGMVVPTLNLTSYSQTISAWFGLFLSSTLLIVILFRTMAARQYLLDAHAKYHYRQWLDQLPLAIEVVTPDGRSHYQNQAAQQMFAEDASQGMLQAQVHLLARDAAAPLDIAELPAMRAVKGEHVEIPLLRLQDFREQERFLRCWGWPGYDESGAIRYGITVFEDISQQEQLHRLKNELIANVSHELRTPLTAIRGGLGLLLGNALGTLPSQANDMLQVCQQNSDRLLFLVNDLLDLQRIEQGKLTVHAQVVNVGDLMAKMHSTMQAFADKFGVHIQVEPLLQPLFISCDPQRMEQVLSNLLSNAVKFSGIGQHVLMRASADQTTVTLEVQDFGSGIPEAFQAQLFQAFAQADDVNTKRHHGTGLGLTISKKLVELMGGDIQFSSQVGHGTRFFVQMPQFSTDGSDNPPLGSTPQDSVT